MQKSGWECIELVHSNKRPTIKDYIPMIFDDYYEMHGDRNFGDDKAITGGIALLNDRPVTIISHVKGKNLAENKSANFAMPHPEGYRKALRLAKQAEKFKRPIICFIDTPGAFCGVAAEERGQGEAIARNLMEFMRLKTPVISIVLGEGGSGGALALGVCDQLAMLENAVYCVISPRGCASILWKDAAREKEAADIMRITATDLVELGVCEKIIPEPFGNAEKDPVQSAQNIEEYLVETVDRLLKKSTEIMLAERYDKFRKIGHYQFL